MFRGDRFICIEDGVKVRVALYDSKGEGGFEADKEGEVWDGMEERVIVWGEIEG